MQYANGCVFDLGYARLYSPRMTIGEKLEQAMKAAKIPSQSALSRLSGVPQATISRILNGRGKNGPETETIRKLAAACNVSFNSLIEEPGDQASEEMSKRSEAEAANDEPVTADELMELAAAYKMIPKKQRELILKSTKAAAKAVVGASPRTTKN
jgi:transcriptional regulator with XRE-family HTH domain